MIYKLKYCADKRERFFCLRKRTLQKFRTVLSFISGIRS